MAIIPYTNLLPKVRTHMAKCPEPLMLDEIRNAAIRLYRYALPITDSTLSVVTQAGVPTYQITPPAESEIVDVSYARAATRELIRTSEQEMNATNLNWRTVTPNDTHSRYMFDEFEGFTLYPTPDLGGTTINIAAQVVPAMSSTGMDAAVFNGYGQHIAYGACAALAEMPDKPWSNAGMVAYYTSKFDDGKSRARLRAATGFFGINPTIQKVRF